MTRATLRLRSGLATLVVLVALPAAPPGPERGVSVGAGACTADNAPARREVEKLLTDEDRADFRRRTGLSDAEPGDVERLADPADAPLCRRLRELVPGTYRAPGEEEDWRFTYFRVAGRYVVTVLSDLEPGEPPDEITFGQVLVADDELEVLGTLLT